MYVQVGLDMWTCIYPCDTDTNVQFTTKRLGRPQDNWTRPLMMTVPTKQARDAILEKAKNLKSADLTYRKIFLKRDMQPETLKEWKRLHDTTHTEKAKPENIGHLIKLNPKERTVTRDGMIIDRWMSPFLA